MEERRLRADEAESGREVAGSEEVEWEEEAGLRRGEDGGVRLGAAGLAQGEETRLSAAAARVSIPRLDVRRDIEEVEKGVGERKKSEWRWVCSRSRDAREEPRTGRVQRNREVRLLSQE